MNLICNNNNLWIRLSFHFTYDTDEKIRDFEIHLPIISVIPMLLYPRIFSGLLIYVYIYIYIYTYYECVHVCVYVYI